jgi:hypothetical protein
VESTEEEYRKWFKSKLDFALGEVQFVQVEEDLWIANLIGQRDVRKDSQGNPPVRYDAIKKGLAKVGAFAREKNASVHMPRIGCGLAGGKWENIEPALNHELIALGVPTTVYDFKP